MTIVVRKYQQVRPSQFVLNYGPGSILESPSGPVVMKSMDQMFSHIGRSPADFEILEPRLSRLELGGAKIARIPSNAELEKPADSPVYPTFGFPGWALCTRHDAEQVLYKISPFGCPCCTTDAHRRKDTPGREAIRFVLACPAGHLDDVDWHHLVHGRANAGCKPDHYIWRGGGRALRYVTIECPKCHAIEDLGKAYSRSWQCRGRSLESGPGQAEACSREARMLHRGAANLRVPVLTSALTIVDIPSAAYEAIRNPELLGAARALHCIGQLSREKLLQVRPRGLPAQATLALETVEWEKLQAAILDLLLVDQPASNKSPRDEEFDYLLQAAVHGTQVAASCDAVGLPLLEVPQSGRRTFTGARRQLRLATVPVTRLRMVMVQKGYQRLDPVAGKVVASSFHWDRATWFPGIELSGEGIFIYVEEQDLSLRGDRLAAWQETYASSPGEPRNHPVHVWWHSLSHRLIRSLAVDSGYSSAAIRERVYFTAGGGDGARGGLLLYAVQPGGDGTLGGLISLVDCFDAVLDRALRDVDTCSNDPLCHEAPSAGCEGAACYSCLLLSETSCEYRNRGLDRLLLAENLP